jgi:putative transcriptional regulator
MDMIVEVTIDEKLKEIGKSAYWLATEIGIDHATLSQIRKNQNKSINREILGRVCNVLKCQPGDLLKLTAYKTPKATQVKAKPRKG